GVRESDGAGWHRGEVVTLVVSVLRGVLEATERGLLGIATGAWWFTTDRRPVFAGAENEAEGADLVEASRALIRRVANVGDDPVVVRASDEAVEALDRPRVLAREIEGLERALFDAAAPQPIGRDGAPSALRAAREPRVIVDDDDEESRSPLRSALA